MNSFPKIVTPRLSLTALQATDIPRITELASNKNVSCYTMSLPYPYGEADAVALLHHAHQGFQNNDRYVFGIRLKGGPLIGVTGLKTETPFRRAELNFWIGEQYWGKGLTTEAAQAAIHFGFGHLGLRKVTATYMAINPASGKVMEHCGMMREGELAQQVCKAGVFYDIVLYGLVLQDNSQFNQWEGIKVLI